MKTQYQDTGPHIAYSQSLRSSFVWQGATHGVSGCPLEVLRDFLRHHVAIALDTHRYKIEDIMSCLAYDDDLGRWAALDVAMSYGVKLPLLF